MKQKHLRAFNIELTNDFINNCRTITIFDNRHLHRVELTTWDWSLSLRGIADKWFKYMDIEIESFTYLQDEHLVYLTKDFRTQIYDESVLHIPQWTGALSFKQSLTFRVERLRFFRAKNHQKYTEKIVFTKLTI